MKGDGGWLSAIDVALGPSWLELSTKGGAGFAFEEELIKKTVDYLCFHDPVCKFNGGPGLI